MLLLPAYLLALLDKTTTFAGYRLMIPLSILVLLATLSLVCSYMFCTHGVDTMPGSFKAFALVTSLQLSQVATAQTAFDSSTTICETFS